MLQLHCVTGGEFRLVFVELLNERFIIKKDWTLEDLTKIRS